MELQKNIFFNTDKLTAGSTVKISYIGKFFQDSSTDVSMYYTFGDDWENALKSEMTKTELGFQVEIDLLSEGTFSFRMKNEKDDLDDNGGNNYVFQIEPAEETALIVVENAKPSRRLRKTYIWSKKLRLAVYKLLVTIPKLLTGNYKRKPTEEDI